MQIFKASINSLHIVWKKYGISIVYGREQEKLVGFKGHWQLDFIREAMIRNKKLLETN